MDERAKLAAEMGDAEIVDYFYLGLEAPAVLDRLEAMSMRVVESQDAVPFNAQVKGYIAAEDDRGHPWILKPALSADELLFHRVCALAYLMDHLMGTLAAPTTTVRIEGRQYRATKVVRSSVQISSYNYMERPFIEILRADLVNRWLFFDEDRNPNNYLVISTKKNRPFVVAIDYDKADLSAETMKITGNPDKFGWFRTEKTRFLTLLRPDNFENVPIETFDARLKAMMAIPKDLVAALALRLVSGYCPDPEALSRKLAANVARRREYIDAYFRSMFKSAAELEAGRKDDYSTMFGESFMNMQKEKQ